MDEYLLKVVVVGNMGVGKTALLLRYTDQKFTENHISTIGVDFKMKTITRENGVARMQLWDTAGQDRFRTIVSSYYRGAEGLLIVYDVTDEESFEKVTSWLQEAFAHGNRECFKVLVGNKIDKTDRVVDKNRAQTLAEQEGMKYFESSAKTDNNVATIFEYLADSILEKKRSLGLPPLTLGTPSDTVIIQAKDIPQEKWCAWTPERCYSN